MPDPNSERSTGTQRQMEIYELGLIGKSPGQAVSVDDLAREAKAKLKPEAYDYLAGGAGAEDTMLANREGLRRWQIVPRLLRNVAERDLSAEILGKKHPAPFLLAPVGVQSILHKDGELAVARAATKLDIPLILSTVSSYTMEEVAAELGENTHWFQLYWPRSDALAASFIQRAEAAGYSAIVVTLDTYLLSWRERDLQNAYLPFLHGDGLANYFSDPVFQEAIGGNPRWHKVRALEYFGEVFSDPSRTWEDLARLKQSMRVPLVVKGVLQPDDARRAVDCGAECVIVSNHGGRQLDGAIAAIDALPAVVQAIGNQATVLFDSGIRRGSDVIKAMALGAKSVLIGRPYCYGLAVGGESGVYDVLRNLIADMDLTLGLAGCSRFADLDRSNLVEAGQTGRS